jgi:ketosteroid isomerase-like protein
VNKNKPRDAFTKPYCAYWVPILALIALLSLAAFSSRSAAAPPQSDDAAAILTLLNDQTAAWNRGDIEGFMNGYWNSNQTEFVSSDGVSHGWQALLERYRRSYPDRKAMGHLTFSDLEIRVECSTAAYALGEYHLQRENDNPSGVFTLNVRKFPEGWRVVVDHTTAFAKPGAAPK